MNGEFNYDGIRWVHYTFLFGYWAFFLINLIFFTESFTFSSFLWMSGVLFVSTVWSTFSGLFVYRHNVWLCRERIKKRLR